MKSKSSDRRKMICSIRRMIASKKEKLAICDEWLDNHRFVALALGLVFMSGVLVVGTTMPGLLSLGFSKKRQKKFCPSIRTAKNRLLKKNYLSTYYQSGVQKYTLTDKGYKKLFSLLLKQMQGVCPQIWDKKWRIVVYDVPEKYARTRSVIRSNLKSFGFVQLQKNVWVFPFASATGLVEILQMNYGYAEAHFHLLITQRFTDDKQIYKHFSSVFC